MEEDSLTIDLPSECVEFYNVDNEAFVESLHQTLLENLRKIEFYLQRYCNNFREEFIDGSADIPVCDITIKDDNKGNLYITFDGYVHSGCRDADSEHDHADRFDFELAKDGSSITLFFPYPAERDPDQY